MVQEQFIFPLKDPPGPQFKALRVRLALQGGLWKLKCPTDDAFLATFPDVVAKQGALWETRINRIKTGLADGSNTLTFPWQPADPSLDGAGGAVAAPRDDAISQQKEVQKFIIEQFRKYGVCSPVMLRAEYRCGVRGAASGMGVRGWGAAQEHMLNDGAWSASNAI